MSKHLDIKQELINLLETNNDVFIEVFHPDRSFVIEGKLMEGFISDNLVLEQDKLCIRYSWDLKEFIDIECYSNGRSAWYRLTEPQFNKIKYYLHNIQ